LTRTRKLNLRRATMRAALTLSVRLFALFMNSIIRMLAFFSASSDAYR